MAEKQQPWGKWFWGDWRKDARLRRCGYASRGLWADMLSLMGGECDRFGYLMMEGQPLTAADLPGLLGGSEREIAKMLADLEAKRVFSRTGSDDLEEDLQRIVPSDLPKGIIFSRRMVRDKAKALRDKENGADGGHPDIRRGSVPKDDRVRRFRRSDNPAKTQRIFEKNGGKCHWCQVPLLFDWDGKGDAPRNYFHIDHVLGVKDGGTNDDANLVPACSACNHDRKYDANQGVVVGRPPDRKAQKPEPELEPKEKKEAQAPVVPKPPAFALPNWIPQEAWDEFDAMRKKIRKPMTDYARKLMVGRLLKMHLTGEDVGAVLDASTKGSWTDVYPIKNKENPRDQRPASTSFGSAVARKVDERNGGGLFSEGDGGDGEPADSGSPRLDHGENPIPRLAHAAE